MSTSSVLRPRRAKAAARFTDVVVFPTPPFWLTTARTRPTLLLRGGEVLRPEFRSVARPQLFQCRARVFDPAPGLAAGRRCLEKCLEVLDGCFTFPAPDVKECEPVVRSRK